MKTRWIVLAALAVMAAGCASVQGKSASIGSVERGAWIAAKIAEAEQLGAKECSPRTLAKAYVALEHVMHEVGEGYYSDAWLEPQLAETDKLVDDLLAERRLAASLGRPFRCVSALKRSSRAEHDDVDLVPIREDRLVPWPAGDFEGPAAEPRS